jgi:SAM-dependent methyltransferase
MELAPQTYDTYAAWRAKQMDENPGRFVRDAFPSDFLGPKQMAQEIELSGKAVLELGSGFGDMALWFAKRGARVTAIELGAGLVEVSKRLAKMNAVSIDFRQGDIQNPLPFADQSFDIVAGFGVLHHLEGEPLKRCLAEVSRVLKPGGAAYFHEPIEDSPAFNFLQNLLPLWGGEPRPSILQRKKWREYMAAQDDRPLTTRELKDAGFGEIQIRRHGLTFRFRTLFGAKYDRLLDGIDEAIFAVLPFMRRFAQTALVRYEK